MNKLTSFAIRIACAWALFNAVPWVAEPIGAATSKNTKKKTKNSKKPSAAKTTKTDQASGAPGKETISEMLKRLDRTEKEGRYLLRSRSELPASKSASKSPLKAQDFRKIKPPKGTKIFINENKGDEADLERVVDQQIAKAFQLSQQYKNSKSRGEIWLRLGELYVEKGRLIEFRLQSEYDKKLDLFEQKKLSQKPNLNLSAARVYYRKAITLYEWFLRDFPKDPKVDQALFFLGYNHFEVGEVKKGAAYYERLTKSFPPTNPYVTETNFALGEYHFENDRFKDAYTYYQKVVQDKKSKLYFFGLYKSAWCLFKEGRIEAARERLETLVQQSKNMAGNKTSRIRMMSEAVKDLVVFYAETGDPAQAQNYFNDLAGSKNAFPLLEKLAYYYADSGHREGARIVFHELIDAKPTSAKAFKYQYAVVSAYANAKNEEAYKKELMTLVEDYGPNSAWAEVNRGNKDDFKEALELRESVLRNYVLQVHQTAQNSRAKHSQRLAAEGYRLYLRHFEKAEKGVEMRFFYGELLFDMGLYAEAADEYLRVAQIGKDGPYYQKSLHNALLALENRLPDDNDIRERVGDRVTPVPFDQAIERFVAMAKRYIQEFPKSEIIPDVTFRLGRLYYSFNQFDEALKYFDAIIKKYPKSKYLEYAANLTLDIYNLKGDYNGLNNMGRNLLAVPEIASSKVAPQIREAVQTSSFKRGEDLVRDKKNLEAARMYEEFATANPGSKLAHLASYNAAINFEKAAKPLAAVGMYVKTINNKQVTPKMRRDSKEALGNLYQSLADYPRAAQAYEDFYREFPTDSVSLDFLFNAAILRAGLSDYNKALGNYDLYYRKKPGSSKALALYAIADLWKRQGNHRQARTYFEKYINEANNDPEKIVRAYYEVATSYEKSAVPSKADEWYRKTVEVQRRLERQKSGVGLRYAAEANFNLAYRSLAELRRLKVNDVAQAQGVILKATGIIERLNKGMAEVVRMDDGPWVVAALVALGEANDHMVEILRAAPLPKNLIGNNQKIEEYKKGVEEQVVKPFAVNAQKNFAAAFKKSEDLSAFSRWTDVAAMGLRKYSPENAPVRKEAVYEVRRLDWMGL